MIVYLTYGTRVVKSHYCASSVVVIRYARCPRFDYCHKTRSLHFSADVASFFSFTSFMTATPKIREIFVGEKNMKKDSRLEPTRFRFTAASITFIFMRLEKIIIVLNPVRRDRKKEKFRLLSDLERFCLSAR